MDEMIKQASGLQLLPYPHPSPSQAQTKLFPSPYYFCILCLLPLLHVIYLFRYVATKHIVAFNKCLLKKIFLNQ